jgi:hypothetical protein
MKDVNNFIIALSILVLAFSASLYLAHLTHIPKCQEDVVLVGIGDFEDGRWDSYICGPAVDDFEWAR